MYTLFLHINITDGETICVKIFLHFSVFPILNKTSQTKRKYFLLNILVYKHFIGRLFFLKKSIISHNIKHVLLKKQVPEHISTTVSFLMHTLVFL